MIIFGYQGIGKSTLTSKMDSFCIDLESSNFYVDGVRDPNWYKVYCQIAINLHKQGYTVFMSAHKVVRDYMYEIVNGTNLYKYVCIIHPDLRLKDEWIKKLEDRYNDTQKDKDYRAWKNAEVSYEENISELMDSKFVDIVIDSMDYSLEKIVDSIR